MRMTPRLVCALGLFCVLVDSSSLAQVGRSDLEISFSGNLGWSERTVEGGGFSDSSRSTGIGVSTRAGYFVSPRVDVGGIVSLWYSDFDDGDSYRVSLGPLFNYHFRPATDIVPFIGASAGVSRGESDFSSNGFKQDSTETGWFAQAQGGADFFLNSNVAIKLQLRYTRIESDNELESFGPGGLMSSRERDFTSDRVDALIGLAVFLDTARK